MPLNNFKISATVGDCDQWYYLFICTKVQAPIQGVTSLLLQKSRLITHTFGQKEAASSSHTHWQKLPGFVFQSGKKDIPKQNRLHHFWSFAIFFGWNDLGTPIFPLSGKAFWDIIHFSHHYKMGRFGVGGDRCQRLFKIPWLQLINNATSCCKRNFPWAF